MLISKRRFRFGLDIEDIIQSGIDPLLERSGSLGNVYDDLVFKWGIEIFKMAENQFSPEGHIDTFPMKDFGVIIESL